MTLNASTIRAHLERHYRIAGDLQPIARGRAANYLVSDGGQRWLLKLFQPEFALATIERAANFVTFVSRAGYPTREFVRSADGRRAVMLADRVAVLIPWIEGTTPEPNQATSLDALTQIGILCGRLHNLAVRYPERDQLKYAGSTRRLAEKKAALVRLSAEQRQGSEISAEADVRLAILSRFGDALEKSHRQACRGIIHGDFSGAHVVFDRDRAVGVIDVMGELYLPGWEMMRAFFQSVPFSPGAAETLLEPWRAYLEAYAREHQIRRKDIEIAYDVYLLQLTASTYGLRPPLDAELRAFGQWRTRLAQYLAAHRAELRKRMAAAARD